MVHIRLPSNLSLAFKHLSHRGNQASCWVSGRREKTVSEVTFLYNLYWNSVTDNEQKETFQLRFHSSPDYEISLYFIIQAVPPTFSLQLVAALLELDRQEFGFQ
jgi:hypothetical protein